MGARKFNNLTATAVKNAKAGDKPNYLFDGGGLYLEVTKRANEKSPFRKVWRMKYQLNKKSKLLTFGEYPYVTLEDARKKCFEARQLIVNKKDPREEEIRKKKEEQALSENTFRKIAEAWFKIQRGGWAEGTAKDMKSRLEKHIYQYIGNKPIGALKRKDLKEVLARVEAGGSLELAKRLQSVLARIFKYAIRNEYVSTNPALDLREDLQRQKERHYPAISVKELPEFVGRLVRNEARLFPLTLSVLWLMMLIFVRTSELIEMRWDEVDLDTGILQIGWKRMKMGRRVMNPVELDHYIQLPRQAVQILKGLREYTGDGVYVFPNTRNNEKPMSNATILRALARMGYEGKMTGHGFRSLASTAIEEAGYRRQVIDVHLAHKTVGNVQKAYFRSEFWDERAEMLQLWADYIDELKAGSSLTLREYRAEKLKDK